MAIICFLINYLVVRNNGIVSMSNSDYGNCVLFLVGAISGSGFVLFLSMILERCENVSKIFNWYGKNSNFILCSHVFVLYAIAIVLRSIDVINTMQFVFCIISMPFVKWGLERMQVLWKNRGKVLLYRNTKSSV